MVIDRQVFLQPSKQYQDTLLSVSKKNNARRLATQTSMQRKKTDVLILSSFPKKNSNLFRFQRLVMSTTTKRQRHNCIDYRQ